MREDHETAGRVPVVVVVDPVQVDVALTVVLVEIHDVTIFVDTRGQLTVPNAVIGTVGL